MSIVEIIIAVILAIFGGYAGFQKYKADRAKKKADKERSLRISAETKAKVHTVVSQAKDDIIAGQKESAKEKQETEEKIHEAEKEEDPHGKAKKQEDIIRDIHGRFARRSDSVPDDAS